MTAGTALALLLALPSGADARSAAHPGREHAKKEGPKPLQVPLIAISIADQRLTLYDKGEVVAHAPVSTGMPGHPTPTGVFSVIGKEVFHRSNIYSGAPMPYMQRITWSGVALHAGVLPGYPASHGCIRMPPEFAVRLFHLTQRGARVIVSRGEITPVPFENPHLFTLLRPADTRTGEVATPPAADAPGVKTAETRTPAVMSDAGDPAARTLAGIAKPAEAAIAESPKAAPQDGNHAIEDVAREAVKAAVAASTAPQDARHADLAKDVANAAAPGAALVKPVTIVPPQPIAVDKTFAPVGAPAAATIEAAPVPGPQASLELQASLEPYGPERPLRPGPITVFVSKKEGKIFIRKGFQQILAEPIAIAHPELALGTHMFTAVAAKPDGASFDWVQVTIPTEARKVETKIVRDHRGRHIEKIVAPAAPPPATAAEALDRIEIPPDAMARIAALMSPGATLIVSDQGLGSETGLDTDFIVLTR
ncbi:MAG TPA: L,D-transpeptidase [Xanthobacteraceae bacterium]|nr:L,D-transpeptidase [Xanthobacteraceae bacterium]